MTIADKFDSAGFPGLKARTRGLAARIGVPALAAIGAGLIALAGLAAYLSWPASVDVVHPRVGPAIVAVYASGTVESSVMLPVAPRVGGRVVALKSDEHAKVVKGQLLAQLEFADVTSNVAQLEAQAAFARNDFDRYQRLMRENAVAPQTYEHARATWHSAEAAVRQARAQASYMTLTAPDDCTVIQRDGEIGQFIAANTPLFWLSCHAALRISAQVDEEDIPLVRVGQKVLVRADAFPGRIFDALVTEVTPKGDPIGRSYRVRIGLPPGCPLRIGMTTEANIVVHSHQDALLLPAAAVTDGAVWKLAGGRARRVPVEAGVKSGDWIEIVKGVAAGDLVVSDGQAPARNRTLRPRLAAP